MKKLFEEVHRRLGNFIDQREHLFMLIACHDFETAYLLKILQAMDESNRSDLFWMFADEFKDPLTYIETLIERFKAKHEGVCEGLKKEGKEPWPPIPSLVLDPSQLPVYRLKELMKFSRSLLPSEEGHLSIWGFFPNQIKDHGLYEEWVRRLIEHQFPFPWCHHMRIFLRDEKDSPILFKKLNHAPRLCFFSPDFSVEAMEKSLKEEVMDSRVPLDQRLQSLMSMAGLDLAHRRYEEALKKYKVLLPYFQGTGNHAMSALILNWMGEAFERMERLPEAQRYYESALTPAVESKSEPVLLNIVMNLANLKLSQKAWSDAELYYESAEKMATALCVPQAKIICLERRGICQFMQNNGEGALESWNDGATLARALEEKYLLKEILQRLKDYYDQTGKSKERDEISKELSSLDLNQG